MPDPLYILDSADVAALRELLRFFRALKQSRGEGMTVTPDGFSFQNPARRNRAVHQTSDGQSVFVGNIVSASGSNYSFVEVQQNNGGTVDVVSGGRSGTAVELNGFQGLLISPTNANVVNIRESTSSSGAVVYSIVRDVLGKTNGTTLSPGSGTTAATTTWAYQGTNGGVTMDLVTRLNYSSTADKLYQFVRTVIIDANGNVTAISAETRSDVLSTGTNCT